MGETKTNINLYLETHRQKGSLAYEYHPFRNYLTNVDLKKTSDGFKIPEGHAINKKNGKILNQKGKKWVDDKGNIISNNDVLAYDDDNAGNDVIKAGSLIDLDTDKLNFDLDHPVDITIQPSYDGSVNLILNDGKNLPRLINSRFSVREKNTYEIVDRIGENDTNIYGSETFDKDTSLYFLYEKSPKIKFQGVLNGGNLLSGTYCYYFTYCDADNNESDIIAESGPIPVFLGVDGYPYSMEGGIKNVNTYKFISLSLSNLDKSYNYFKVYLLRYFADYQLNRVFECKKLYNRYPIKSSTVTLQITGNEEGEDIDASILNIPRFNPKNVLTQAQCKNMLFFGNVVKNSDNYKELLDCALRIVPSILKDTLNLVDFNYLTTSSEGYYNSKNIYDKTGYFNNEFYRFGVVFIYNNGTLSNVYNTLGTKLTNTPVTYKSNTLFETPKNNDPVLKRQYIQIDDFGWIKNETSYYNNISGELNAKGVCKIEYGKESSTDVLGIKFTVPEEVVKFLKEDLDIRGMFFVRQKRIPSIIAQCYLMPFDELLEAPVLKVYEDTQTTSKEYYYTECFLTLGEVKNTTFNIFGIEHTISHTLNLKLVSNNYLNRMYEYKDPDSTISSHAYAAICPDFLLNLPYYNQIFNGSEFNIYQITSGAGLRKNNASSRYFSLKDVVTNMTGKTPKKVIISSVTDNVSSVAIKDKVFKLNMGEAEEAYRFKYCEYDKGTTDVGNEDSDTVNNATNLVRGIYSPYLAIYSELKLETGELYNIYLKSNNPVKLDFQIRMDSSEPFYAISDRYNFDELVTITDISTGDEPSSQENGTQLQPEGGEGGEGENTPPEGNAGGNNTSSTNNSYKTLVCWRGDCYTNTFTYRLNRNFNDPSLPNNDKIIDKDTWLHYDINNPEEWLNISRSDLNAVQMGSWITIKCRSYMNYALRSQDHSFVSEEALMGAPRSYYPRSTIMWSGINKMPDSYVFNDAYRASLGFKCYFTLLDVNYIKDTFSNRIQYSAISILDSYKNNYRESLSTYFRDYSQEYGSILKLVGFEGYLLVVFEHAIGVAVVNERVLAGNGDGEPVFINTNNVLPEELTIITDTYGTQWGDSVIKSEAGYVYGVDTIAKKIWRVKGLQLEILSDFKVNEFLVNNITLSERELYPTIGLRNVKTHYNNNKKDLIFTFYDDVKDDEENAWSLCYNELLGQFITFYSWIPSFSENIDTQFFTFNRNTAKELSLLGKCNYNIPENTGVLLDTPIMEQDPELTTIYNTTLHYVVPKTESIKSYAKNDYKISTENFELKCFFKFKPDHWGNYKLFEEISGNTLSITSSNLKILKERLQERHSSAVILEIIPYRELTINNEKVPYNYKSETIAVTFKSLLNNITTDFYLHGQSGIFELVGKLYPTYWYNEFHPFEFEFVVNDKIALLKVFTNLMIISNKAEPESFHFEIEGDNYEFSEDKRTMYFRLEATKELYLSLGSNMLFDRTYTDIIDDNYTHELYYRGNPKRRDSTTVNAKEYTDLYKNFDRVYPIDSQGLVQQVKSTIFPLYYERVDSFNDIYYIYREMLDGNPNYDFKNLSGSEIKRYRNLNLFNIVTHIKNSPIDLVGRLRGNSFYKEGKWNVQIPSIIFNLKNEVDEKMVTTWVSKKVNNNTINIPPIVVNSSNIPNDLTTNEVSLDKIPNIYINPKQSNLNLNLNEYIDTRDWTYRKEARIRDKWIKVRIRYSGKNLAIIHSIVTLYNISYS